MNTKLITQHRRGTQRDWNITDEIPKDGELIIEQAAIPKIKVGNGNSEYKDLPYITDDLDAKIITERNRITELIAGSDEPIEGSWESELRDIRVIGDNIYKSAGEAVRSIYNDVKDFIDKQAVDGLQYNLDGDYKLYLTSNGNTVGEGVQIIGGAGGGGLSDLTFDVPITDFLANMGQTVKVEFNFTSTIDGVPTGAFTYELLNTDTGALLETGSFKQSKNNLFLDITNHLKEGSNNITFKCIDVYKNYRQVNLVIDYIDFKLTSTVDSILIVNEKSVTIDIKSLGDVNQSLYIDVYKENSSDPIIQSSIENFEYNTAIPCTIDLSRISQKGIYDVRIYAKTSKDKLTLYSNELKYKLIMPLGTTVPMIAAVCNETSITTLTRLVIPYKVYDPNISINSISKITVYDKSYNKYYVETAYYDKGFDPIYLPELPAGKCLLKIDYYTDQNSNASVAGLTMEINVEEKLKPTLVPNNMLLNFDTTGKTNTDLNSRNTWISNIDNRKVTGIISDCTWEDNGWLRDESLQKTFLRLYGDAKLNIDYAPFAEGFFIPSTGLTIELEFSVRNVNKIDQIILSCLGDNGSGFSATSDKLTIISSLGESLSVNYKQDEVLHLAIVIDPPYEYSNTDEKFKRNAPQFLRIYLNGVLSAIKKYTYSADTKPFNHNGTITFGDSSCWLDIYSFRIYQVALQHSNILRNYITGLTINKNEALSKNAYYEYDDQNNPKDIKYGLTEYNKIKDFIPTVLFTGAMPQTKGDKRVVYMDFINPQDPDRSFSNWYAGKKGYEPNKGIKVEIDVQGTSSAGYIRKNWKIKLKKKSKDEDPGFDYNAYQHMPDQIPTKVFCLKVDYAEATGTHNTQNANLIEHFYSDLNLPKLPAQQDNAQVRTTIAGFPCVIFERETEQDTPKFSSKSNFNFDKGSEEAFGFTEDYDVESWEFCNNDTTCNFKQDFDPSQSWLSNFEPRYTKEDFDTLEKLEKEISTNKNAEKQRINTEFNLEVSGKDENSPEYLEAKARRDAALEAVDNPENESLYLTTGSYDDLVNLRQTMISTFKQVFDWVRSTDTTQATNIPFDSPIDLGGKTYDSDTADYRLSKFRSQFTTYFDLNYSSIYYVYTFFALMTDQRAKNMFLTRWGNKWYPYFYDNDTCFGINNSGDIAFSYFAEDTDPGVYNGANSVLWTNFGNTFKDEIKQTYHDLRNSRLSYASLIKQFITEGSNKWTPSIYNEDAEYKYVSMARPENAKLNNQNLYQIDETNLKQVRGTGDLHFKYFVDNRITYCDSKWTYADFVEDRIEVRPNYDAITNGSLNVVPGSNIIELTSYINMYGHIQYRQNGYASINRLYAGQKQSFNSNPLDPVTSDAEVFIYGASNLTSLGDLSPLYCRKILVKNATRLKQLTVGNHTEGYNNSTLAVMEVSNCSLLEKIDLTNCSELGAIDNYTEKGSTKPVETTKILNLSDCLNIKEIYLQGTKLKGCSLPTSGYLEYLYLPSTIQSLKITNQPNLNLANNVTIEGKSIKDITNKDYDTYLKNITILQLQSIGKKVQESISNVEVLKKFLPEVPSTCNLNTVNLNDIEWECTLSDLTSLYTSKEEGGYGISDITLTGNCYISHSSEDKYNDTLKKYELDGNIITNLRNKIKGINLVFNEDVTVKSTVYFHDADGNILTTKEVYGTNILGTTITAPDNIKPTKDPDPTYIYTWQKDGWSQLAGALVADPNALKNILGDRQLYPVFTREVRKYNVTYKLTNLRGESITLYSTAIPCLDNEQRENYSSFNTQLIKNNEIKTNYIKDGEPYIGDDYVFNGWLPIETSTPITEDREFTANFKLTDYIDLVWDDITDATLKDDTMVINRIDSNAPKVLNIPNTIQKDGKNYTVIGIHEEALGNSPSSYLKQNLLAINLSACNSITKFPGGLFDHCIALKEIICPPSLNFIGTNGIKNTKIKILELPATLNQLDYASIYDNDQLSSIIFKTPIYPSTSFASGAIQENDSLENIYVGWDETDGFNNEWFRNQPILPKIHYDYTSEE